MFKFTILLIFLLNSYHCYKQPMSGGDYGAQNNDQTQQVSVPKPQAIIHLPQNVYAHKVTDTIKLDHEQLSNYLSSINYIPHTIHKHAQLLAQLDPAEIQKYGQSVNSNQLPLISLTVPEQNKNSDYNDAQVKVEEYQAAPQQDYAAQQPQSNSGYQQDGQEQHSSQQQPQQDYTSSPQQSYSPPQAPRKNCNQNKNSGGYTQQENNSQEYGNSAGYEGGSNENAGGYDDKSSEIEYQSGPQMDNNNYDSDNNNNHDSGSYYSQNSGGYENNQEAGNSYENNGGGQQQPDNGGYSNNQQDDGYSNNQQQQDYAKSSNGAGDYSSENYESSPFDYNFVQEILKHVMNQLEQLQIDPENLNVYGKAEDSNQGGNAGNENGYNSQNGGGYEVQGGRQGIQLVDRPAQGAHEVDYGYSINHGSYESQPAQQGANSYEPSYTSSSTTSQATSYAANEPVVVLDNKIPINENKAHSTVTYQMPTINLELPRKQIEHIMKAVSNKKGGSSHPIMIKANSFKLPPNLNLGKIKTIAFVKSSKLGALKDLPYLNAQMLGSNINSLSNYKLVSAMSKKDEVKYDGNPVISAYGYGVGLPSSKMYATSSNKKSSIILPLKSRSKKRLGHSYSSLQAASSNIKSIISALPKLSKSKKSSSPVPTASVIATKK